MSSVVKLYNLVFNGMDGVQILHVSPNRDDVCVYAGQNYSSQVEKDLRCGRESHIKLIGTYSVAVSYVSTFFQLKPWTQ